MSAAPAISAMEPRLTLASPGTVLRAYESMRDLEGIKPQWSALLAQYPAATTFSTWEWLHSWWNAFAAGRSLLALGLWDRTQSLVGLALFAISVEPFWGRVPLRVLRLLGDGTYDSDNLDLPVVPGYEDTFATRILEYLRQNKSRFDLCEWNTLPLDSLVGRRMAVLARSQGWLLTESPCASSAVTLPPTWEQYLESLASEDRKNLPRYTRRLQNRHRTRIFRCNDTSTLPACLEALFRLHQERWRNIGHPGAFATPERRGMYEQLSRDLLAQGWLQLWALELDSELAAVQFAFRYRDRVFQLQEGYDHHRASDRLGYVLRGHVLKTLISEGVRTYDFLAGEDSYKTRWGAHPGHYQTLRFALPFTRGGILFRLGENTSAGKQWLRKTLPPSAWSLLRKLNETLHAPPRSGPQTVNREASLEP